MLMSWRLVIVYLCCVVQRWGVHTVHCDGCNSGKVEEAAHCRATASIHPVSSQWSSGLRPPAGGPSPFTDVLCVVYRCKIYWRSINKVLSFQIQYILYSPIIMIKLSSLYLYFSFTWHHACEMFISLYANRYSKLMSQWMMLPFILTLKNYLEHFGG